MQNHEKVPGCLWKHWVWQEPCALFGGRGRTSLQTRQDFKMHPTGDPPEGAQRFLSSLQNEDPGRLEEKQDGGRATSLRPGSCNAGLLLANKDTATLTPGEVPCKQMELPPSQLRSPGYADEPLPGSRVLSDLSQSTQVGSRREVSVLCFREQHGPGAGTSVRSLSTF